MAERKILLLGNEKLYKVADPIREDTLDKAKQIVEDLNDTIDVFKSKYGYGRAIAAPQIDELYRVIFMKFDDNVIPFINPVMKNIGEDMYELWDDCMSFPGLEIRVKRYRQILVKYKNLEWEDCQIEFHDDLAELFQHEYDHLNGILAVQRAVDDKAFRINPDKVGKF